MASSINKPKSFGRAKAPHAQKGFTLVELMVAITEGSIVMALVLGIFLSSVIVGTSVGNYADLNAQSKIAMATFEGDLRSAESISFNPATKDTTLTAKVRTTVDAPPTDVTYNYIFDASKNKGQLTRNGVVILSDIVGNDPTKPFKFLYFDRFNQTTTVTSNTRMVMLTATLMRTNMNRNNTDYLVSASVKLRNKQ